MAETTNGAVKVKRGHAGDEVCESEAKAVELAKSREKGPRQAFKVTYTDGAKKGRTEFRVSHNRIHVAGVCFLAEGHTIEQLYPTAKERVAHAAPATAEAVLAVINGLPEAERGKLLEAWEAMKKGNAPAKPAHAGRK